MTAPLNASATTIGSLLSNSTFEIPAYQREYAWKAAEVAEFWHDLSLSVSGEPYFLGLIIVTGERRRKDVVDGQQRLLTITLLAAALRHEAVAIGRKALADRIHSTLLWSMDYNTDESLPRIVLTDIRANDTLHKIVADAEYWGDSEEPDESSSTRLISAYQFLRDQVRQGDRDEIFRRLGAWMEFINERLYVAVFEHPDEAAAYSVFEVVNTRGRQLTTADLLKNYILRNTAAELRETQYDRWQRMLQQFEGLGSGNFVQFIRHVINLDAGYVLPKDLYNYVSGRGEFSSEEPLDVEKLMQALENNLQTYLQLLDPTLPGPVEGTSLGVFVALNELGISAVRPLLLAIVSSEPEPWAGTSEVLRLIVKRIVVGNLGTGSVERKFAEAAHLVHQRKSWSAGLELLKDMDHDRDDFVSQLGKRSYNRSVLTFIRRSIISQSLIPESIGTLHYLRSRSSNVQWDSFSDEDATFWASTLGNVILAQLDRRPRGANTWPGVKEHLLPRATEGEYTELVLRHAEWTPASVQEVGAELAEIAADVWC